MKRKRARSDTTVGGLAFRYPEPTDGYVLEMLNTPLPENPVVEDLLPETGQELFIAVHGWGDSESKDAKAARSCFQMYGEKLIGCLYEVAADIQFKRGRDNPAPQLKVFFERAPQLMRLIDMSSMTFIDQDVDSGFTLTDKGEVFPLDMPKGVA